MVDIRPFPGIRYSTAKVGKDLTQVACPPYDVISPAERAALVAAHPRNFVRLELPVDAPGDASPTARYERAAAEYRAWQDEGVLAPETRPALYAYLQQFEVGGEQRERRGFIAALRLEPWESRGVRPHEKTLSGPKQDRFQLIRACRANFSPIWVLYRDPADGTARLWDAVAEAEPDLVARDRDGCLHTVWALTDPAVFAPLLRSLRDGSVYIADGHHRYETALHYQTERGQAERRAEGSGWSGDAAPNFALTYFVDMADPGLIIHGTHRLIRPPQPLDAAEIRAVLARWFDFTPGGDSAAAVLAELQRAPGRPAFGVWAPALGLSGVALLRQDAVPEEHAAGRSAAWGRLDLAALHTLAVDAIFSQGTAALSDAGHLWYTRLLPEVDESIAAGAAQLAFLVRETPAEQVIAVADAGDLMPEKSTYFYPKPLSGMVMASLDGELAAGPSDTRA
jgi:uncharacterized protein (DUF1015 family)